MTPAFFQNLNSSRQLASSPAPVETQTSMPMLGGIAALLFSVGAQLGEFRLGGAVGGVGQHHPSVTPFRDAPERQIVMPPEPDRHAPRRRQRIDAGVVDVMPLPLEGHMRLGPQGLHDLHLLLRPSSPIVKILVQTDELHLVPADPDPQPKPAAAQHVKAGGLLGDQHGLSLGQDEHLRREADSRRATAEKPEQDERIVEEIGRGVSRAPVRPARDIDPQNVIGGREMIVAGRLRRLGEQPDRGGIAADIGQRQCNAEFHRMLPTHILADRCDPVHKRNEPSP